MTAFGRMTGLALATLELALNPGGVTADVYHCEHTDNSADDNVDQHVREVRQNDVPVDLKQWRTSLWILGQVRARNVGFAEQPVSQIRVDGPVVVPGLAQFSASIWVQADGVSHARSAISSA